MTSTGEKQFRRELVCLIHCLPQAWWGQGMLEQSISQPGGQEAERQPLHVVLFLQTVGRCPLNSGGSLWKCPPTNMPFSNTLAIKIYHHISLFAFFYHNSLTFIFIFFKLLYKIFLSFLLGFGSLPSLLHPKQAPHLFDLLLAWDYLLSENLCQGRGSDSFFLIVPGFQIGKDSAPTYIW